MIVYYDIICLQSTQNHISSCHMSMSFAVVSCMVSCPMNCTAACTYIILAHNFSVRNGVSRACDYSDNIKVARDNPLSYTVIMQLIPIHY